MKDISRAKGRGSSGVQAACEVVHWVCTGFEPITLRENLHSSLACAPAMRDKLFA